MLHCIYLAPQLYLQKGLLRIKSFIHSFIKSFIHSFIHSFIPSSYGVITCAYILIIAKIVTYYTYLHKHSKKYIKIVKIHHSILD